jgi:hypothetical protein
MPRENIVWVFAKPGTVVDTGGKEGSIVIVGKLIEPIEGVTGNMVDTGDMSNVLVFEILVEAADSNDPAQPVKNME